MSDNYFRSVTGLLPAPYPESQPIQSALEQTSPGDLMSHAQFKVDSVKRLLDQPEMYHDRTTMSNTLKPPTPRGSTTPVTMATAFHPIEKMPSTSTEAQTMQALNLLHKSPSTSGSIIRGPTPMRIVDLPVDKSESSAEQTQNQPVIPVSFVSTTQVRMDIVIPSPVDQGVPQVPPVQVPLLQITSVAKTANKAVSMASQQSGTLVTTQPQQQTEQRTSTVTSTTASTMSLRTPPLSQAQLSQTHQQAPVTHKTMQQVPLQAAGIEERMQCLANGVNQLTSLGLLPPSPAPPAYTSA